MSAARHRKDVLTFMPLNCTWAQELIADVQKTCLTKSPLRGWIPIKVHIVDNPDLEEAYEDRKEAMRAMGRSDEELKEQLCFMAESWKSVVSMCKYGVRCSPKKTNILGDTRAGLHLNRHYDMLLRFMTFRNFITARCVVVFKVIPGRVKRVMPRFKGRTLLHPSKHYDAHVSMIPPDANISVCEGLANNFIYIYQLDEETKVPLQHPRQAIPYAVIQLRQPFKVTVARPFSSFRDRFRAQLRSKETVDRKNKSKTSTRRRKDDLSQIERRRRYSGSSNTKLDSSHKGNTGSDSSKLKESRKRSATPASTSSCKNIAIVNVDEVGADPSLIQTKLLKIEEEIKLRQSKLTQLRHIKISHDQEKSSKTNLYEEEGEKQQNVSTSANKDDQFAPKITSVFSTSSIGDLDVDDYTTTVCKELSSGASTPTLDEPGDQESNNASLFGSKTVNNESGSILSRIQENMYSSLPTDMEMKVKEKDPFVTNHEQSIKKSAIHGSIKNDIIGETIGKEKQEISLTTTQISKQEEKAKCESLTVNTVKILPTTEQINVLADKEQVETTIEEKSIDIKTLFREAIYKMDPSDLYELLTEKLANSDEEDQDCIDNDNVKTTDNVTAKYIEHSDCLILDLSCKNKDDSVLDSNSIDEVESLLNIRKPDKPDNSVSTTGKIENDTVCVTGKVENNSVSVTGKVENNTVSVTGKVDNNTPNSIHDKQANSINDKQANSINDKQANIISDIIFVTPNDKQPKPDTSNKSQPSEIGCDLHQHNEKIKSVDDHSYSMPLGRSYVELDNLDILASVASGLQPAESTTKTDSSHDVILRKAIQKCNAEIITKCGSSKLSPSQIENLKLIVSGHENECAQLNETLALCEEVSDQNDTKVKIKYEHTDEMLTDLNGEQEYIFDAENFVPGQLTLTKSYLNTSNIQTINLDQTSSSKNKTPDKIVSVNVAPIRNICASNKNQSHVNKVAKSSKKTNPDTKLFDNSCISQVLASTKRKTANSVAAALAASENSNIQTSNLTSDDVKQKSPNKRNKQNRKTEVDLDTTKTSINQPTTLKSKAVNNTVCSTDTKINCRENLFDKFASTDIIDKSGQTQNSNDANKPTCNTESSDDTNLKDKEDTSSENKDLTGSTKQDASHIKTVNNIHCSDTMCPLLETKVLNESTLKTANSIDLAILIKQEPVFTESKAISHEQAPDKNISNSDAGKQNDNELYAASNEVLAILIKQEPYDTETVGITHKQSPGSKCSYADSDKQKDSAFKTAGRIDLAISIKQELVHSATTTAINRQQSSDTICPHSDINNVVKKKHVSGAPILDESIVDLMDKKVTEEMKQSGLSASLLSVIVKQEPTSPTSKYTCTESKQCIVKSSVPANKQVENKPVSDKRKNKSTLSISQNSVVVKTEPQSPENSITLEKTCDTKCMKGTKNNHIETTYKKTSESKEISSEIDKTLKDLEQVIGIFSQRVRNSSDEIVIENNSSAVKCSDDHTISQTNTTYEENKSGSRLPGQTYIGITKKHLSADNNASEGVEYSHAMNIPQGSSERTYVEQTSSSHVMSIEVITGNASSKKMITSTKVPQEVTTKNTTKNGTVSPNKVKSKSDQHSKQLIADKIQTDISRMNEIPKIHKNATSTDKTNSDDTTRTTRVLQAALKESSNKVAVDTAKRIKKEPVTEDEYYGISRSNKERQKSPQKHIDKKCQNNDRDEQEVLSESKKRLESSSNQDATKVRDTKYEKSKQKSSSDKYNSRDTRDSTSALNPLEAIKTHFSSSKRGDGHHRQQSCSDSSKAKSHKTTTLPKSRRKSSRSGSVDSSRSSSTESPSKGFSKRDDYASARRRVERSTHGSRSPHKFSNLDSTKYNLKSKWDSNESITSFNTDNNSYSGSRTTDHQAKSYDINSSNSYSTGNKNFKKSSVGTYDMPHHNSKYDQNTYFTNYHDRPNTESYNSDGYNYVRNKLSEPSSGSTRFDHFSPTRTSQTSTYANKNVNRISVKRERSNSLNRNQHSGNKRIRSSSNERGKRYDGIRHRSDSHEGKRESERKRQRTDSGSRDERSYHKRNRSRSRGREGSLPSEHSRRSPRQKTRVSLHQDTNENRFDIYKSVSTMERNSRPSDISGNRLNSASTSEYRDPTDSEITNTLSKAMSTLLKKIIFNDKVQDNSKEGKMADMVLDMVKARIEEQNKQHSQPTREQFSGVSATSHSNRNNTSRRSSGSARYDSPQTTKHSASTLPRSRVDSKRSKYIPVRRPSRIRISGTTNINSPCLTIFNGLYTKHKFNQCFKKPWSSRRGVSYSRPWSNARSSISSRSSTSRHTSGVSRIGSKYSSKDRRLTRGTKSPSK